MMKQIMIFLVVIAVTTGCKKEVLIDEASVRNKILVNNNPITDLKDSDLETNMIQVEGKMNRIAMAMEAMEPDTTDREIKSLMDEAEGELKDARKTMRKVLRSIDKNEISTAEARLAEARAELESVESKLMAAGY